MRIKDLSSEYNIKGSVQIPCDHSNWGGAMKTSVQDLRTCSLMGWERDNDPNAGYFKICDIDLKYLYEDSMKYFKLVRRSELPNEIYVTFNGDNNDLLPVRFLSICHFPSDRIQVYLKKISNTVYRLYGKYIDYLWDVLYLMDYSEGPGNMRADNSHNCFSFFTSNYNFESLPEDCVEANYFSYLIANN